MMKSTDFRERDNATFRRHLDASWRGRVHLQSQMRPALMVIGPVPSYHATQMPWAQNDHVIQRFVAQGTRSGAPRTDFGKG
jgi:hypothetical protein